MNRFQKIGLFILVVFFLLGAAGIGLAAAQVAGASVFAADRAAGGLTTIVVAYDHAPDAAEVSAIETAAKAQTQDLQLTVRTSRTTEYKAKNTAVVIETVALDDAEINAVVAAVGGTLQASYNTAPVSMQAETVRWFLCALILLAVAFGYALVRYGIGAGVSAAVTLLMNMGITLAAAFALGTPMGETIAAVVFTAAVVTLATLFAIFAQIREQSRQKKNDGVFAAAIGAALPRCLPAGIITVVVLLAGIAVLAITGAAGQLLVSGAIGALAGVVSAFTASPALWNTLKRA